MAIHLFHIMYQKLLIPIPACKCSSSSPLQSQMSFCQYLAQVTADGVQPGPGGCTGGRDHTE